MTKKSNDIDKRKEKQYAYWLCNLATIGNRTIYKLLSACGGTAKGVYYASQNCWQQVLHTKQFESIKKSMETWKLEEEYQRMLSQGISFLTWEEENYPLRLRNIPDAPYGIFYKGRLPKENVLSVAIIGARECSSYGTYVAIELGKYLGERGVQIISGMARGIDGISQEAALMAGGDSFGVLGCGVDICYPAQNKKLYDKLILEGGILSTYLPGTLPKAQYFPMRNRIVSGLADVLVVIEARNKSGTLITVDMALEQGKEVYVVPGRVTDRLSDGCNSLIKQGAGILLSPQDFLEEICKMWEEKRGDFRSSSNVSGTVVRGTGWITKGEKEQEQSREQSQEQSQEHLKCHADYALSKGHSLVYKALDFYPQSLQQIMEKLPDSYNDIQVNTILLQLCMKKLATQLSSGYFCLGEKK